MSKIMAVEVLVKSCNVPSRNSRSANLCIFLYKTRRQNGIGSDGMSMFCEQVTSCLDLGSGVDYLLIVFLVGGTTCKIFDQISKM